MKAATIITAESLFTRTFQSTPPVKAATQFGMELCCHSVISIHAAREGGDTVPPMVCIYYIIFQSTPPVKAATHFPSRHVPAAFISIHAAREGGDVKAPAGVPAYKISIHAAREGGDFPPSVWCCLLRYISIHAAREGGDKLVAVIVAHILRFQSTPPVKAATKTKEARKNLLLFQSTPPVKAATLYPGCRYA